MSNLRAAPGWLTPRLAGEVSERLDHVATADLLRRIGLSGAEIVALERIAAMSTERPEIVVGEMVRAALAAIEAGGWRP